MLIAKYFIYIICRLSGGHYWMKESRHPYKIYCYKCKKAK